MELAQTGIQLAQSGRRTEALDYLRRAVQQPNTTTNAEVWLWLAHVTPDLQEYRHCVAQALMLNPTHPIASQMQSALQPATPYPVSPPPLESAVTYIEAKPQNRRRVRRRLLLLLILSLAGLAAILLLRQNTQDKTSSLATHTLSITANNRVFQIEVPQTWLVADKSDPAWQAARQSLENEWPTLSAWGSAEVDLTRITVQPNGFVQPPVTIIETAAEAIAHDQNNPLRLQWIKVIAGITDTTCAGVQAYAEAQTTQLQQTLQNNIVSTEVRKTHPAYCIFVMRYRGLSPLSNEMEDIYVIHVPLDATTLAEWHLTVRDAAHSRYLVIIDRVLNSIKVVE